MNRTFRRIALVAPSGSDFILLQHAEQLALEQRIEIVNLVERIVPLVRPVKPGAVAIGAGERSLRYPDDSLSNSVAGIALQLIETKGPSLCTCSWISFATSSLPVPVSPISGASWPQLWRLAA